MVPGDRSDEFLVEPGLGGEKSAGVGVVETEAVPLGLRPGNAGGVCRGDRVQLILAERERHHELAAVVQQAAEVGDLRRDVDHPRGCCGDVRDRYGVNVHLPARQASVAGSGLEEAKGDGFKAELARRLAADHHHGLPNCLRLHRARVVRRIRETKKVDGKRRVRLERDDELAELGLLVVGQREHPLHGSIHHGEAVASSDRLSSPLLDIWCQRQLPATLIHSHAPPLDVANFPAFTPVIDGADMY